MYYRINYYCMILLSRIVHLAMSDLVGQGTFGMEENKDRKEVPLQIKEAGSVIK